MQRFITFNDSTEGTKEFSKILGDNEVSLDDEYVVLPSSLFSE